MVLDMRLRERHRPERARLCCKSARFADYAAALPAPVRHASRRVADGRRHRIFASRAQGIREEPCCQSIAEYPLMKQPVH
jgi:hypothetical protein